MLERIIAAAFPVVMTLFLLCSSSAAREWALSSLLLLLTHGRLIRRGHELDFISLAVERGLKLSRLRRPFDIERLGWSEFLRHGERIGIL